MLDVQTSLQLLDYEGGSLPVGLFEFLDDAGAAVMAVVGFVGVHLACFALL